MTWKNNTSAKRESNNFLSLQLLKLKSHQKIRGAYQPILAMHIRYSGQSRSFAVRQRVIPFVEQLQCLASVEEVGGKRGALWVQRVNAPAIQVRTVDACLLCINSSYQLTFSLSHYLLLHPFLSFSLLVFLLFCSLLSIIASITL